MLVISKIPVDDVLDPSSLLGSVSATPWGCEPVPAYEDPLMGYSPAVDYAQGAELKGLSWITYEMSEVWGEGQ